jgi:predicted nucleotidyltransferase
MPSASTLSRRTVLLNEATRFVRAIRPLHGVVRVALLGSIITDASSPKDIDFLVTVTDDADLRPLAASARRLQGRAQSAGAGADVFLARPDGTYLGRTCPWKECWPGRRVSCDARHCGKRPHLHDDLATITLAGELIAAPPLELHPQVVRRCTVPADVEAALAVINSAAE